MTKKKRLTLHDRFAKVSLQEKPIALDFFKAHLPQKIQTMIDWKTLKLQPGVFIDEDYEARYTDILYRVEMDKQPGYLFVLTEHQSNPDPLMAFRLWNYLCKIWDRHLAELDHERKTDKKKTKAKDMKLPLIYPLTVYHGKITPYPFSMDLFDLFQNWTLDKHRP